MINKVIPINSDNVDYWQWGKNCQILKYEQSSTANIIDGDENATSEDFDEFWEGYYSEKES